MRAIPCTAGCFSHPAKRTLEPLFVFPGSNVCKILQVQSLIFQKKYIYIYISKSYFYICSKGRAETQHASTFPERRARARWRYLTKHFWRRSNKHKTTINLHVGLQHDHCENAWAELQTICPCQLCCIFERALFLWQWHVQKVQLRQACSDNLALQ